MPSSLTQQLRPSGDRIACCRKGWESRAGSGREEVRNCTIHWDRIPTSLSNPFIDGSLAFWHLRIAKQRLLCQHLSCWKPEVMLERKTRLRAWLHFREENDSSACHFCEIINVCMDENQQYADTFFYRTWALVLRLPYVLHTRVPLLPSWAAGPLHRGNILCRSDTGATQGPHDWSEISQRKSRREWAGSKFGISIMKIVIRSHVWILLHDVAPFCHFI